MSDDGQIQVPPSFVALYLMPGSARPNAPRAQITERHEFCDDLAQMLTEPAQARLWDLGITESDVLQRMHKGLLAEGSPVSEPEARWVICRLAELLGWTGDWPGASQAVPKPRRP